jgi:hypothetical protein
MSPICGGTLIYAALHADTPNLLRVPLDGALGPNWRPGGDTPMNFEVADDKLQPQLKLLVEHETNRFLAIRSGRRPSSVRHRFSRGTGRLSACARRRPERTG